MTDDLVNTEMRLAAIEYLLCQLWVSSMKFAALPNKNLVGELINACKYSQANIAVLSVRLSAAAVAVLVNERSGIQKMAKA